jgi:hypothetical protein
MSNTLHEKEGQMLPLEITEKTITIESLHTEHLNKIRFDLAIQRGKVWTIKQRSLFIYTIMVGYRFPEVFAQIVDGYWFILDGKQRMTTVFDFLEGKFELDPSTPDVYGVKVAGLDYASLPKNLRRKIKNTVFRIVFFENMTIEQRDENFYLLNNGSKLSALEKNRSKYSAILEDVKKITDLPFFSKMVNLSKKAREGLADEELVYSLSLLLDKGKDHNGLGSRNIEKYIDELKAENRSINVKELETIAKYLEEAFKEFSVTECKRSLKRADVVAIFLVAKRCVEDGMEADRFGEFIRQFFANLDKNSEYALTRKAGSTKKENINRRVSLLAQALESWIIEESLKDVRQKAAADIEVVETEKTELEQVQKVGQEASDLIETEEVEELTIQEVDESVKSMDGELSHEDSQHNKNRKNRRTRKMNKQPH